MQDLFTYPSPFTQVSEQSKIKIRDYIQKATESSDCLTSNNIHDNIKAFYELCYPQLQIRASKKRKRSLLFVTTEELANLKDAIITTLRSEMYIEAFNLFTQYCKHHKVPCRVLEALSKQDTQVVADGCLFSIKLETLPLCKYYQENNRVIPMCPSKWNTVMIHDGIITRVFAKGVEIKDHKKESIFMAISANCPIPQVQVFVNGQFIKPYLFWKLWRNMINKQGNIDSILKPLLTLIRRVYPPANRIKYTDPSDFIQTLWDTYVS
jgi:hypothetical protein